MRRSLSVLVVTKPIENVAGKARIKSEQGYLDDPILQRVRLVERKRYLLTINSLLGSN